MPGRKVSRTNIGLGVGSYAWSIPFNLFVSSCFKSFSSFYYSHSSSGMFLEHFGSNKSNHGVFTLFLAHHGCDNCVEGSDSRISCLSLSRFCSAFVQDLAVAMELESYKQDRLFQQTVHRLAQALPGRYRGSRHAAVRYIYRQTTLANFIELKSEQPPMTPAEFFELLSAVPGVLKVVPHPKSKLEQKKFGHHYQQRTFLVYSQAYPRHGMEFELTTHNHEKNCSTISALYKTQGNRPRAMAWQGM